MRVKQNGGRLTEKTPQKTKKLSTLTFKPKETDLLTNIYHFLFNALHMNTSLAGFKIVLICEDYQIHDMYKKCVTIIIRFHKRASFLIIIMRQKLLEFK